MKMLFLTFLVISILSGCKENSPGDHGADTKILNYNEIQKIFAEHLYLEGQTYTLKLSLKEAVDLGVTEEAYDAFIKVLAEGNRDIQKSLKEGVHVIFSDPQKDLAKIQEASLKITDEAVQKIFAENLYLEGQNYVLHLTLQEALALGVSEETYDAFIKELAEGNRNTQECLEQGIKVIFSDPQKDLAKIRQKNYSQKEKPIR